MPKVCYIPKRFGQVPSDIIIDARRICEANAAEGFNLTLRQIYYQFVGHDLFPDDWTWTQVGQKWVRDPNGTKNAEPNYKKLGVILNDARLAGMIDWMHMVDRTRTPMTPFYSASPDRMIEAIAKGFSIDKWEDQDYYIEAWIEKDALEEVLSKSCDPLDVSYFSCRGYTSQSAIWSAAQRLQGQIENGKTVVILHLGDHDPSGIDMTRDIETRLSMFMAQDLGRAPEGWLPEDYVGVLQDEFEVRRIALNMDQIERYNPPPNPAKLSDSRGSKYIERYGVSSWELDAMPIRDLVRLVQREILTLRDEERWQVKVDEEEEEGEILRLTHERWEDVKAFLREES